MAPLHLESNAPEAATEAAELVGTFLQSERAAGIVQASQLRREVEFVLPWPLDQRPFAGRYLHGLIDCLYQDRAGDWHLVDYKSNQVASMGIRAEAQPYALQMFVYSMACERALGVRPVESVLHFLRPGEEYAFQWNDVEYSALASMVDQAIQAELEPGAA